MKALKFLRTSLSLDFRSLALYRMLMGLVVMMDVIYRIPDFENFYTDIGLIPRKLFLSEMGMPWSFSLHLSNGSLGVITLIFAIHFLFGLMLFSGYKTRWATIGAYLMTVSVHNRNWLVNNGGDDILRAILFLSIFLPLNRCFSMDSALKKNHEEVPEGGHFSTWGLAFFFQVFAIYYVSYILKYSPQWRSDFTALFFALRLDIFATPIGVWLRDFPGIQKFLTILTIYLEWLGPLVLVFNAFFGKWWWLARLFTIMGFWGLHLGIIITMNIGIFPWMCLGMWLIFLPTPFWDWMLEKFRRLGFSNLTIYFDGECLFCQKGVQILKDFFLLKEVNLNPGQSNPEIFRLMEKNNSWVVVNEKNDKFFHFNAFIEVVKHSPLLFVFSSILSSNLISKLGEKVYKWVASHRQLMSKWSQFFEFQTSKKEISWLKWLHQVAGAFILVTLIMWNLTTIKQFHFRAPFFQKVTRWLHLYQEWNMFAPFPKMDNIWVEVPGVLADGSEIEVITWDRDIFSIKDKKFYESIANEHWRKFYLNVSEKGTNAKYYAGYLCRLWNERKIRPVDQSLQKMDVIVYSQMNLPDGSKGPINRKHSWKHWCFQEDYDREHTKQ